MFATHVVAVTVELEIRARADLFIEIHRPIPALLRRYGPFVADQILPNIVYPPYICSKRLMYMNRRCEYNPAGQSPNIDMTPIDEFGCYRVYGGGYGRKRNFSVPRRAIGGLSAIAESR
jgi:hypothetical protein